MDSTQLNGFLLIDCVRNGSLADSLMFSLFYFLNFIIRIMYTSINVLYLIYLQILFS